MRNVYRMSDLAGKSAADESVKFSTAATTFSVARENNENLPSFLQRPTTALFKVLERIPFNMASLSTTSGSLPEGEGQNSSKYKPGHVLAGTLDTKISKVMKHDQKVMGLKSELINAFCHWSKEIPNTESSMMVKDFGDLLLAQKQCDEMILEKLCQLKLHLAAVNEREKKQKDLINAQSKILRNIRESEVKYGPNSSQTSLLKEELEENIYNLEIVEIQFVRSITKSLKDAFINYLLCLQTSAVKNLNAANKFYDRLMAGTPDGEKSLYQEVGPVGVYNSRDYISSPCAPSQQVHEKPESKPRALKEDKPCAQCTRQNNRLMTPCTHNPEDSHYEVKGLFNNEVTREDWS